MKMLWVITGFTLLVAAGGSATVFLWRQPETTAAMRGQIISQRLGCLGCHGPGALGGIADPAGLAGTIPGWDGRTVQMYATSEQEIREWILYGTPREQSGAERASDSAPLVPMPAYEDSLSEQGLDDLVAYFQAVSGRDPDIPDDAFEGRKVAAGMGCFGCHGPSGMGGVQNPGSFKGHIPPWDSDEFAELVRDDQELREWIMDGRPRRLWENPAARYFLQRQKTPMPAYRDYLSDVELNKLVAYIRWLRSR